MRFLRITVTAGLIGVLAACGGGGSGSGGTGTLTLSITDAPVSDADLSAVWVRFTSVIVKPGANGSQPIEIPVSDNFGNPYIDVDLKSLTGGKSATLLGQHTLATGHYSWIRLIVDPAHTYVVESGGSEPLLDCSSCDESHLKLNRSFSVEKDGVAAFTIDFDLRQSITLTAPQSMPPRPDYAYKLRPTLRIVDNSLTGTFSGTVEETLLTANAGIALGTLVDGDSTGCSVYVFDGADVTPDDMFFTEGASPSAHSNPVTVADVYKVDAGSGGFAYRYTAAFLPAGDYTAALTCDAETDDPAADEPNVAGTPAVIFLDQQNISVQAGTTTENVDF